MKLQNLSVRAFLRKIVAGTLLTAALLLLIFFLLTKDVRVVICGIILTAAFYIWGMVFLHYFQKKLSLFTDGLCQTLDHMMDSTDRPQVDYEAETLLSRISHRLERLWPNCPLTSTGTATTIICKATPTPIPPSAIPKAA